MKASAKTDIGRKRQLNQDQMYLSTDPCGILPNLFIVADGMGGHRAGGYASSLAVETIQTWACQAKEGTPAGILTEAIRMANRKIADKAASDERFEGMGTTVVACVVQGNVLHTVNVGDSRLYLMSQGRIQQISEDHSLVQEMVKIGELTPEEARIHPNKHIITRAVGLENDMQVDSFMTNLPPDSRILLCSDGLTDMLEDQQILQLSEQCSDVNLLTRVLVDQANEFGGKDNIAVIVIDPFR